jgi:hypothetical protein
VPILDPIIIAPEPGLKPPTPIPSSTKHGDKEEKKSILADLIKRDFNINNGGETPPIKQDEDEDFPNMKNKDLVKSIGNFLR